MIAAICVVLLVTGYVLVTDMRIRGQPLYEHRLRYLSKRDKKHPVPEENGHEVKELPAGARRRSFPVAGKEM